ncbi:MAG: hypothetical protein ACOYXT_08860 [Bacteroidota bacterium]
MRLVFCIVSLLTIQSVCGQHVFNSPYSVYGLGLVHDRASAFNHSLGGTGIAVRDEFNLNHVNPASYNSIISPISHIYEAGFYIESNHYETQSLRVSKTDGSLTGLGYWFRFSPRWSAALALLPMSSVSYNIRTEREIGTGSPGTYRFEGKGNISQLSFGNSLKVTENLSLGVRASLLFGALRKNEIIEQEDLSSGFMLEKKVTVNKLDFDFGLQYKINVGKNNLVLGVTVDDGLSLRGVRTYSLFNDELDTLHAGTSSAIRYSLPFSAGGGLAFHTKRSIVSADAVFKKWSNAYLAEDNVTLLDTWRFSIGYVYKGNVESENYWNTISFRAGYYVQQHYMSFDRQRLPNYGFSTALSFPIQGNRASINLTYSYDKLGTVQNGLILQQSIDLVVRDIWGFKHKVD